MHILKGNLHPTWKWSMTPKRLTTTCIRWIRQKKKKRLKKWRKHFPTLAIFKTLATWKFKLNLKANWFWPKAISNLFLSSIFMLNSEKAMAPHSSTLAWKIPWTEEPGRLQSMVFRCYPRRYSSRWPLPFPVNHFLKFFYPFAALLWTSCVLISLTK